METEAREELDLLGRPLSDDERNSLESRIRLKRAETKLATKRDKMGHLLKKPEDPPAP